MYDDIKAPGDRDIGSFSERKSGMPLICLRRIPAIALAGFLYASASHMAIAAPSPMPSVGGTAPSANSLMQPAYYYRGRYYPYRYHGMYYGHRYYRYGRWHYY